MNFFNLKMLLQNRPQLIRLFLLSISLMTFSTVSFGGNKDCYTCNPDYVPGSPVEGNKTLGQLSQISIALLSDADGTFMGNLYAYCMDFPGDIRGAKTLKKRVISEMEKNAPNGKIDSYFLEAGCNPDNLGSARVPLAQIAAELPSDRLEHLEVIKKYFIEKKKDGLFTKMLNAKNTQGHTTLDYLNYLLVNKKFDQTQIDASEKFKNYLCSHGAVYSHYKNKSCETVVATK